MKKIYIFLFSCFLFSSIKSQILTQDMNEANKLIEAYFSPLAESYGTGLNSGWYNTAKPHKLFGFDLTFNLNTVINFGDCNRSSINVKASNINNKKFNITKLEFK